MKKHKIARARSGKQKVLLVDDHPVVREGLAERINRERDLVVCGEAQNAREALRAVASLQPDIVILDLSLPKGHGLELVKDLRTSHEVGNPRAVLPRNIETILAPNARGSAATAHGIASSTPSAPGGSTPTLSGVSVCPPL